MIRSLSIFFFFCILPFGCGREDVQLRPVDLVMQKIGGTWRPLHINLDGVDVVSRYSDFRLTFSGADTTELIYFSTNGRPDPFPWPVSGTVKLGTREDTDLVINPDRNIVYAADGNNLEFTMDYMSAPQQGPIDGDSAMILTKIVGTWVFTLTKEQ